MSLLESLAHRLVEIADKIVPQRPFKAYQIEFAFYSILTVLRANADELTALFARQSGKSETVTRVEVALTIMLPALALAVPDLQRYEFGYWVGIFAPVKSQAKTTFDRISGLFDSPFVKDLMAEEGLGFEENNAFSRVLTNGSMVRAFTASPTANIESATFHKAVVEESQDVGYYKLRKSIEPMLTATRGTLQHIGTANEKLSPFYEAIQRNKRLERDESGRRLHFQYAYSEIIKHHPDYRFVIEKKLKERGEAYKNSDEFRMAYDLEFILSRGQFCSFERFDELESLSGSFSRGPYDAAGRCLETVPTFFGIDWGKSGDSTVVTALGRYLNYSRIFDWLELKGDRYTVQYPIIVDFIGRFPGAVVVLAESNGVGDACLDGLLQVAQQRHCQARIQGFFSDEGRKSNGYLRLFNDMVNRNGVLFPADDAARASAEYQNFAVQMTELEKGWKGSLMKCQHPDKEDAHDDYCDSLMLANVAATTITSVDVLEKFFNV